MKIAMVCTEKLPVPPVSGGAVQLYIEGILPYLSQHHEITVYSIEHPSLAPDETVGGVHYVRVSAKSTQEYVNNLRTVIGKDFDLVHVFNRPLWILALGEKLPDTRFSLSLHNEMFHPEKISEADALKCINRVEFINAVSRFIAEGVVKRLPVAKSKMNVVYSGADIYKYKPVWTEEGMANKKTLKQKYSLNGYKVVLFVGRLSNKKGVHILLKALKTVMSKHKKVALVIVGSKWFGENKTDEYTILLKNLAKELTGPIVFTGFLPPSEIPPYYNLADVFVCPSQWNEPLARVHYEAMAAGIPIITTNRGGNSEVIHGYGNGKVINDYSNPETLASCINYFLENPAKCLEHGKKGRKLAEEKFNWERVAKEIFKPVSPRNNETIAKSERKDPFTFFI
ncbi:MAG: glycosyltransferase family 4 protein [Clostridia bacterium]|nr:glycosyltransferase family 4 protein [Clostridia bacterium]